MTYLSNSSQSTRPMGRVLSEELLVLSRLLISLVTTSGQVEFLSPKVTVVLQGSNLAFDYA